MPVIIYPGPDEAVGSRPEIVVRGAAPAQSLEVAVFPKSEFEKSGPWAARPAAVVDLQSDGSGDLAGVPDRPLAEGNWIVCVLDRSRRRVWSRAEIRVEERADAWGRFFARVLAERLARLEASPYLSESGDEGPLFSLITPVHNADPCHLENLAHSVLSQSYAMFEWLILDNGSSRTETSAALDGLELVDARIRIFRGRENLHIVGGHRFLLERARGRFVVPVDHDDLLYPDALERLAHESLRRPSAGVFFSHEHRISPLGSPVGLLWRPEWSLVHALATDPAAHLMAYRRDLALANGVYTGEYARGSVDWDTILRLVDAGASAARVPEVLYGWRVHPGSTAMSIQAKQYVESSQRQVIQESLRRRGLDGLFSLARVDNGYYHWIRRKEFPPALAVDFIVRALPRYAENLAHNLRTLSYPRMRVRVLVLGDSAVDAAASSVEQLSLQDSSRLGALASEVPQGCVAKAIIDCANRITDAEWAWDAIGTLELDADTGLVTGPVLDHQGLVASAGYVAGMDGFFGIPRFKQPLDWIASLRGHVRHGIMAAHSGFLVLRAGVPQRCGPLLSVDGEDALYGIEYCLRCRAQGIATAYTPRMRAERDQPFIYPVGTSDDALREHIAERYGALIFTDPYYSGYLSRDSFRYGELDPCYGA